MDERSLVVYMCMWQELNVSTQCECVCFYVVPDKAEILFARQPGHTDRENLDFDPILARMCPLDEGAARRPTDVFERCVSPPVVIVIIWASGKGRVRKKEENRQIETAMSLKPNYALVS